VAIFLIVFAGFFIGVILIALLKKTSPQPLQESLVYESEGDRPLYLSDPEAFKSKCLEFLERFNLEYEHSIWANDNELEIIMRDETPVVGGTYLALCIIDPPHDRVDALKVKGFLDTVKGEGASRGIFITTGFFTHDAIRTIEEEPVELVNVHAFLSYLRKFGID